MAHPRHDTIQNNFLDNKIFIRIVYKFTNCIYANSVQLLICLTLLGC